MPKSRKSSLNGYGYVTCRHYLHAWEHSKWIQYVNVRGRKYPRAHTELVQESVCLRCGTIRSDRYNPRSFERIGRSYTYPSDYLQKGEGLKKQDFTELFVAEGKKKAVTIDAQKEE